MELETPLRRVRVKCPKCGEEFEIDMNLELFTIKATPVEKEETQPEE